MKKATNIRLDEALFEQLKEQAALEDRTLTSILSEGVRDVIAKLKARRELLSGTRIPVDKGELAD